MRSSRPRVLLSKSSSAFFGTPGSFGSMDNRSFSLQLAGRVSSPFTYLTELGAEVRSGAWSVWKAVLVKPFVLGSGHRLELSVKVDNLFDFRDVALVDPGRRFTIGVSYGLVKR